MGVRECVDGWEVMEGEERDGGVFWRREGERGIRDRMVVGRRYRGYDSDLNLLRAGRDRRKQQVTDGGQQQLRIRD